MIARILALAPALVASSALACSPTVGAHLATYHVDRSAGYDEFNPGVYVVCNGYTAGVYHNSEGRTSAYAGYTVSAGRFDLTVGVVAGYAVGPVPMVIPSVRLPFGGFRLALLPPVPVAKRNTAGIHLMKDF